jgi:hypothetical protein
MPGWLTLPLLINLILIGMALEAGWLIWRHRGAGMSGLPPFLLHVVSGLLLLLAMKLALQSAHFSVISAILGMAGIVHFFDLKVNISLSPTHLQRSNSVSHRNQN